MNHGVIPLFTLRDCRGIIFLMDEIAACVTVVGIRAPADTHTPFVSNQVIDTTHLQLRFVTEAILCRSHNQIVEFRRTSEATAMFTFQGLRLCSF